MKWLTWRGPDVADRGRFAPSRTGVTSPLGKLTEKIPALRVSAATMDGLRREANKAGVPFKEFVREVLDIRAVGEDEIRRMHERRINLVSGKS